jgi:hypothetical protein
LISYHGTQLLPQNSHTFPDKKPSLLRWRNTSVILLWAKSLLKVGKIENKIPGHKSSPTTTPGENDVSENNYCRGSNHFAKAI